MTDYTGTTGDDILAGSAGADKFEGLAGDDTIIGIGGNDVMFGAEGDDIFYSGAGSDTLYGGTGSDTANYDGSLEAVIVDMTTGTVSGGDAQGDALYSIENVVGTEFVDALGGDVHANAFEGGGGNDVLSGRAGDDDLSGGDGDDTLDGGLDNDILDGGDGNDAIFGGAGDDLLKGFAGADRLDGGEGYDEADYSSSVGGVVVSLAGGAAGGDAEGDVLVNIEGLLGSFFADTLSGNAANNSIFGADGADVINGLGGIDLLEGGEGNDRLDGGANADTMVGGNGNDVYVVDDAKDVIDETGVLGSGGIDLVESTVSFSLANKLQVKGDVENLTLLGNANIDGTGNDLANTIVGNTGANRLDGKGGADTLRGLAGNDTYVVDNTGDVVDERGGSSGIDTVVSEVSRSLSDSAQVKGQVENLTLRGTAAIDGTGNDLANVLIGNAGGNVLRGLAGNDTLTGGDGADSFVFDTALNKKTNLDAITDFTSGDTIVLDQSVFGKLKLGELKLKAFHEGGKAHDGNDRILYNEKNGKLTYDANGDGKGGAIKFAVLDKGLDLSEADFLVI